MFTVAERDGLLESMLASARDDPRVVGAALVGSWAHGRTDEWSDIDLLLAVSDDVPPRAVLDAWALRFEHDLDAVVLFDLVSGEITYRVFLLPNSLEIDLSVTSASTFFDGGPTFRLVFGETVPGIGRPEQPASEIFGYAAHHVLHARVAIERGRSWQAEYWISAIRDYGLELACMSRGLDGAYGKQFDDLPEDCVGPDRGRPGSFTRPARARPSARTRGVHAVGACGGDRDGGPARTTAAITRGRSGGGGDLIVPAG